MQGGREGDDRSAIYADLLTAEEAARARRAGMHAAAPPPPAHFNDVAVLGAAQRARQYLPFMQRAGSLPCVVEAVMSGSRLKLYIAKESVVVAFSPSGVRTPSRGTPARGGAPAGAPEAGGVEAFEFVRAHYLQRDAVVSVEGCDKMGTFLGRISVGAPRCCLPSCFLMVADLSAPLCGTLCNPRHRRKLCTCCCTQAALHRSMLAPRRTQGDTRCALAEGKDMSLALLQAGLGSLHPSFSPDRVAGAPQLLAAQAKAQAARKGVWANYDADAEAAEAAAAAADAAPADPGAPRRVTVTHVDSAARLYLQVRHRLHVALRCAFV